MKIYGINMSETFYDGFANTVEVNHMPAPVAKPSNLVETQKPKPVLHFDRDPLAMVCALLRLGRTDLCDIHGMLEMIGDEASEKPAASVGAVDDQDQELADKIRNHFTHSVLMRRLNDQPISNFMNSLEEVLDQSTPTLTDQVKILVKLPAFYREYLLTDEIFKGRSQPAGILNSVEIFDNTILTFVGMVKRKSKNEDEYRYYCATQDNIIVAFFIKNTDRSYPVWDYLMAKGKFCISGQVLVGRQAGYDQHFYKLGYNYEIKDVNS